MNIREMTESALLNRLVKDFKVPQAEASMLAEILKLAVDNAYEDGWSTGYDMGSRAAADYYNT